MNKIIQRSASPLSRRDFTRAGLLLATGVTVGACSSDGSPTPRSSGSTKTLRIGQSSPPNSLDPARINQAFEWYVNLAYDPLIYKAPDGSLQPRLAKSFRYIGEGNTEFEMTLRDGVKFSDGSPLTADVVVRNIEYFRKAGGQAVPHLAPIRTVRAVDPGTIRLTLSQPHPLIPMLFTQDYLAGNVISGKALDTPDRLAKETFGAGPYVLDASKTVANDRYVYRPNPEYWNADDIQYDEVSIKVIPNPNTAVSALQTGQLDVIQGDFTTAESAEKAGLQVTWTPLVFVGLAFADRDGSLLRPLGDVRVRQAINYALDRKTLATAVFGKYGTPTEQIVPPGWSGYNDDHFYEYDVNRARTLLNDAGYPNGFAMPTLTTSFANQELIVLAIADQLRKIGITLDITSESDTAVYVEKLTSGKFPAYGIGYGSQPVHLMGAGLFLPNAGIFNPRKSSDPELDARFQRAAAAPAGKSATLDRQVVRWLAGNAWFAPAAISPVFFFANDTVAGIEPTPGQPIANPVSWHPAR